MTLSRHFLTFNLASWVTDLLCTLPSFRTLSGKLFFLLAAAHCAGFAAMLVLSVTYNSGLRSEHRSRRECVRGCRVRVADIVQIT